MKQFVLSIGLAMFLLNFGAPSFAQTTAEITRGNCRSCAEICQQTADYCNKKRGQYGEDSVTNALKDCINSCKMTEDFLVRGSKLSGKSSALCFDACNECAKSCDKFPKDKQMANCANECRKSAGNLQKLVQQK